MRLDDREFPVVTLFEDIYSPSLAWMPDDQLAVSIVDPDKYADVDTEGIDVPFKTYLIDPATGTKKSLGLPGNQMVKAISPDGTGLICSTVVLGLHETSISRAAFKDLKPELIGEPYVYANAHPRFSPNGKFVVGVGSFLKPADEKSRSAIHVYNWEKKTEKRIDLPKEFSAGYIDPRFVVWSLDGTRLAFLWKEEVPMPANAPPVVAPPGGGAKPKWYATRITTCDVDGANLQTILKSDGDDSVYGLDWARYREPAAAKPMNPVMAFLNALERFGLGSH